MALEHATAAGSTPSAQVVGNAFVHQYYHILHQSPELVHRFYQEGSKLGRPEADGTLSSVTTIHAINEKILSMDYSDTRAEIVTVDAQESLDGGVLVLVTGCLTGGDNVRRHFTQSFFLATQDNGYYVLNDILQFVKEDEEEEGNHGGNASPATEHEAPLPQEQQVIERAIPDPTDEEEANEEEVCDPVENENGVIVEEEVPKEEVIDPPVNNSQAAVVETGSSSVPEEAPKKSYASIVKVMKESTAPVTAPAPIPARPTPLTIDRQAILPASASTQENSAETNSVQETEADGHSIYIKNLPLNATPAQLEEEFKKFGPIKPGGIQVRSHKQGFCYGFVEFEVANAVQSAIEASSILIGGRQAYIEEKRPSNSRGGGRGRFMPGRGGGFRNDGGRGWGNYSAGRGYGRGDYNNRANFSNRGGGWAGPSNRPGGNGGGYQRVDYSGSYAGRGTRPGSLAGNASPRNVAPRVPASA